MKKSRYIIGYLDNPNTWDKSVFETAIREEVEASTGPLTPSDEFMIGSLSMTVNSLIEAELMIRELGLTTQYNSGTATSPWYKIRTEMADKAIKILGELGLVARGRPKLNNKVTTVDELFTAA